jgi:hypothetical protein
MPEGEICFILTNAMSWLFIVSTYKKPTPQINMPLQSDTLSCFRANQSLLLLLNAVCLVGKQQIQVLQSLYDPTGVRAHDQPYSRRTRLPLHQSIDAVNCIHDVCKQDTIRYKSIRTLNRLNVICETRRAHQIQYRRSY